MRVVDMVSTGDEAIESIKINKPDIVILDICLTGIDGLGVMEHISELPEYKDTTFVVLTSVSSQRLIRCAFEMGATYYILKPYNPVQLVARLRQMYIKKQGEQCRDYGQPYVSYREESEPQDRQHYRERCYRHHKRYRNPGKYQRLSVYQRGNHHGSA